MLLGCMYQMYLIFIWNYFLEIRLMNPFSKFLKKILETHYKIKIKIKIKIVVHDHQSHWFVSLLFFD